MATSFSQTVLDQKKKEEEDARAVQNDVFTPTNPAAAAAAGASPDSAKMAGTGEQKAAVMTEAAGITAAPDPTTAAPIQDTVLAAQQQQQSAVAAPDATLGEAQNTAENQQQQFIDKASERAKGFSEKLSQFGSLGQNVENLVGQALSGLTAEGEQKSVTAGTFEITPELVSSLADQSKEGSAGKITEALNVFQSAETPEEAFQALAGASEWFENPSAGIMEMIQSSYKTDPDAQRNMVANAIAADVIDPDQITMESLISTGLLTQTPDGDITELGLSVPEIQEMIGDNWATLTPGQIEQAIEDKEAEVAGKVDAVKEKLTDPNIDPATRETLTRELQRMGAIGQLEADQSIQDSKRKAADAGKLVIGGEVVDVGDLLSDENIQQDVKAFLAGGEEAEQWKEDNPEFAAWIEKEQEELGLSAENLKANLGRFEDIQSDNKEFQTTNVSDSAGVPLDSAVMDAFGFGDGFHAEDFNAGTNEIYKIFAGYTDEDGVEHKPSVTRAAVEAMNAMSPESLKQLSEGFQDEGTAAKFASIMNSKADSQEFLTLVEMENDLDALGPNPNANSLAAIFLGDSEGRGKSAKDVTNAMDDLRFQAAMGDSAAAAQLKLMSSVFDADGDGVMDNSSTVLAAMKGFLGDSVSMDSLASGGLGSSSASGIRGAQDAETYAGSQADDFKKIKSVLGSDGILSKGELDLISTSMTSPEAAIAFFETMSGNSALISALGINKADINTNIKLGYNKQIDAVKADVVGDIATLLKDSTSVWNDTEGLKEVAAVQDKLEAKLRDRNISPIEKAALTEQLKEIRKATASVGFPSWTAVKNYESKASKFRWNSRGDLEKMFPEMPSHILNQFVDDGNGQLKMNPISGGKSWNAQAQEAMTYIVANEFIGRPVSDEVKLKAKSRLTTRNPWD